MSYPLSHKTVFVLDCSPAMERPCGHQFEMDSLSKGRSSGLIPLAPVTKTMWTCAVEAAVEYCRIVWDIYPSARLIRLIANGAQAVSVNDWTAADQHLTTLMQQLAGVMGGVRSAGSQHSLHAGLAAALHALGEPSEAQRADRAADAAAKVMNRGRVVVVSQLADDGQARRLREWFADALLQHNRTADGAAGRLTVHSCELVLVSVHPDTAECGVTPRPPAPLSAILSGSVVTAKAGTQLAPMMMNLVLSHYELASTTVTGIPMKEEQNSGSSANYDVELLHPAKAYESILQGSPADHAHLRTRRDGCEYETITLKWCTPRTSSAELHQCTSASRVTPVDVNSRPSSCLTNFLLSGRAVMLEMPRRSGGKFVSHMLAAHGGEIFMHALGSGRSVLEDPPSVSEGAGGRVTDYRITEFGRLVSDNRLAPGEASEEGGVPLHAALERLARHTRVWPMTLSESCLAALPSLDSLTALLVKDSLSTDEVLECKKAVYNLVSMEARHEPLPVTTSGARGRGVKREEQYRALWSELEALVRAHCRSDGHQAALECVLECRSQGRAAEERLGLDQAMEELDRCGAPVQDSPLSPPPTKRWRRDRPPAQLSLLEMWNQRVDADNALKRLEFSGRLNGGDNNIVKLYAKLDKDKGDEVKK
ncbi:Integrator complex subunit 13 [Amphibalanus amphitrite]|uniref:Protein asunder n=1 Tax=Amphibalanus amphitrite TaxID=1232801 RepID=A0A6A4WPQ7_AMPAM|nr:Integrator complex subunit 13 [Amphibalanus amphitrite]